MTSPENLNPQQFFRNIEDPKVQADMAKLIEQHPIEKDSGFGAYQKAQNKHSWYASREQAEPAAHWLNVVHALQIHITEQEKGEPLSRDEVPHGISSGYDITRKGVRAQRFSDESAYRKPGRPKNSERDL